MNICSAEENDQSISGRLQVDKGSEITNQEEFEFVEQPSEEFFCPVTFELLLNPHQTTCCGHHLSEKAVNRLQRESKPCPMCKESKLITMPDKFFKRKASAVLIRCPYKESECEWVGEVGGRKQHIAACPKRPWECEHCDFTSTFDVGIQHIEQCTKYPVPCPNKCEVGMVPRCDVEKHRTDCSLESVACEFAEVGCSVKVARRDLKRHMEESQQQHLLSATLLNLKLTKETIAELNRQLVEKDQQLDKKDQQLTQVLLEKDKTITAKDRVIAEKDMIIAKKEEALAVVVTRKDKIISEKETQLSELQTEFRKFQDVKDQQLTEVLLEKDKSIAAKDRVITEKDTIIAQKDDALAVVVTQKDKIIAEKESQLSELQTEFRKLQQEFVDSTKVALEQMLGTTYQFVLESFTRCQEYGGVGDWFSDPFSVSGCNLKLNVETRERGRNMTIRVCATSGLFHQSVAYAATLQLLNQLGDHSHVFKKIIINVKDGNTYSAPYIILSLSRNYTGKMQLFNI